MPRILASLKGITIRIGIPAILGRLVGILIRYIFAHLGFVQPNGVHIVAPSPKAVAFEIALQPAVFLEGDHGAFALQIPHDGGHRIFGRNRQTHMDMVRTQGTFDDFYSLVSA